MFLFPGLTIDASVNGGLKKYQEAFFDPNYIEQNINYYKHIKRLKKLIFNQINLLETGLAVHQRLVPNSLLPLHEMLVEKFSSMKNSFIRDSSYIVDIAPNDKKPSILSTPLPPIPSSIQQNSRHPIRNSKDFSNNNGNSSEDDLYSALESDNRIITRQSLSPSSLSSISSSNSLKHKSSNGLIAYNTSSIPHNNSSSSLLNGQTNSNGKIVYVTVSNEGNHLTNNQQRSNSMQRNNMQQFNSTIDPKRQPQSPTAFSNYPPLPPKLSIISQSKLSLESGIETDLSSEGSSISKPVLPKRTNKKTVLTTNLDHPSSMTISIEMDKNKQNTVISSNTAFIESSSDIPPPLPKKNRIIGIPTSRSTTVINIGNNIINNTESDNNGLTTNHLSTINNGLFNNHFDNNNLNNSTKSTSSSISTLSMSTSSSTNEHFFTETFTSGNTTTTTVTSTFSSNCETIHHQIQNLSLNDLKDH